MDRRGRVTMASERCKEAMVTRRALVRGDAVAPSDERRMRGHLAECETCRVDSGIVRGAARLDSSEAMDELALARLTDGVIRDVEALDRAAIIAAMGQGIGEGKPSPRWGRWGALVAGIAAAVALAIVWRVAPSAPESAPPASSAKAAARAPNAVTGTVPPGAAEAVDEPTLIALPYDIRLLVSAGGQVAVETHTDDLLAVRLSKGAVLASVNPHVDGPDFRVVTKTGSVTVTGTIFSVDATDDALETEVLRGSVEVATGEETVAVTKGHAYRLGDEAQRTIDAKATERLGARLARLETCEATACVMVDLTQIEAEKSNAAATSSPDVAKRRPTAAALLDEAEALQDARQWPEAAEALERLMKTYPKARAALISRITLGNLQLDRLGNPAAALKSFDKYLASKDPMLRKEALLGKASALEKLGRREEEIETLEHLVAEYPTGMQTRRAEQRLSRLRERE